MPLDPLEGQLGLPAIPAQLSDLGGLQCKVVGQAHDALAGFVLPQHDPAQSAQIVLARIEHGEHTGLNAQDIGVDAIDQMLVAPPELRIRMHSLHSSDSRNVVHCSGWRK